MVYVALLYSIVVGPRRRVVMSDLKAIAEALRLRDVRTLIATGNLVFEAEGSSVTEIETALEAAIASTYGKAIDVIVRDAPAWRRLVSANPFPEESKLRPSQVAVRVQRDRLSAETFAELQSFTGESETIRLVDGDLWMDFRGRISMSRLSSALTRKRVGKGTSRNWNTIRRLGEWVAN